MAGKRRGAWAKPDRMRGDLPRDVGVALLGIYQARGTGRVDADSEGGRLGLFAKGASSVAMVVLLLVGGCARAESPTGTAPPTPTEVPTETPTERPTSTVTPAPTPQVVGVSPSWVPASQDIVTVYVRGQNIGDEPYLFLAHPTHGEIEATDIKVYPGGSKARCAFDISEAKPGLWSVHLINVDGTQAELGDAFEVVPPTPTATATSTPSPTLTATTVIVIPTDTPTPAPTAMPTAVPKSRSNKKEDPTSIPTLPPPSSQP